MDLIFAIRGLLSFVAFTEFTNAIRCFWPLAEADREQSFIHAQLFSGIPELSVEAERTLCHAYGLFSGLVGLIIIHAAIFAHYRPLVSLALCAESLKLFFLLLEAFIFGSVSTGLHLIFPVVTGFVTVFSAIGLLVLTSDGLSSDDENLELVRRSKKLRKNR